MHKYGVSTCIDGDFPISGEGELNELRQADTNDENAKFSHMASQLFKLDKIL